MPPLTRPETHYARSQRALDAPCACVTEGTVFTRRVRRESRPNVPRRGECLVAGCRSGKCRGSWADVEKRVAQSRKIRVQSGVSIDFGKQPISFVRNESPRRSERSSDSIGCLVRSTNRVIARSPESKIRSRRVGPHRIVHVCFPPWNNRHATIALRFGFAPRPARRVRTTHTRTNPPRSSQNECIGRRRRVDRLAPHIGCRIAQRRRPVETKTLNPRSSPRSRFITFARITTRSPRTRTPCPRFARPTRRSPRA